MQWQETKHQYKKVVDRLLDMDYCFSLLYNGGTIL